MMAFRDAQLANEQLSKVLTEADIPNLQGHVDVDASNRKGWGSFGEVFVGQYKGNSVCVKTLKEIAFTEDRQWEKFLRKFNAYGLKFSFLTFFSSIHIRSFDISSGYYTADFMR